MRFVEPAQKELFEQRKPLIQSAAVAGTTVQILKLLNAAAVEDPAGFVEELLDVLCADPSRVPPEVRTELVTMARAPRAP